MKKRKKYIDFSHRRSCLKHAWCALLAVSLLTAGSTLHAEKSSALPAKTVAHSANASVSASSNGSAQILTDTAQGSEINSSNTVGTQTVASDITTPVGTSALNATHPSRSSVASAQTASTGTSNGVLVSSSTGFTTGSSATGTSGATASNATTAISTGATVSPSAVMGTTTSATGTVSGTMPNVASPSQTPPAPANIPLGGTTALAGTNGNPSAPEEEEPQDLGDILDLRPPAKLKVSLLPWVIALLIVLSAIGLWFLLKRKRHGKAKKEKPTKPIDPYEEVLQALKEASKKLDVTNPKPFAFFLTDAVRLYLSRVFRLPAPESTTQELLEQLPWCTELTDDLRTNITQFLQRCDLVKFTTMPFDEPFLLQLHQQAEAIVAASHELTKPKTAPAASAATGAASSSKPEKTSKK